MNDLICLLLQADLAGSYGTNFSMKKLNIQMELGVGFMVLGA